ncbi:MAG: hypothetical protein WCJ39_04775 [bacterium]
MVPDQICNIDPQIRKLIQRLKRNGILTKCTTGELYTRLQNTWEYIEPLYARLLEEDKREEDKKNEQNEQNKEPKGNKDKKADQ